MILCHFVILIINFVAAIPWWHQSKKLHNMLQRYRYHSFLCYNNCYHLLSLPAKKTLKTLLITIKKLCCYGLKLFLQFSDKQFLKFFFKRLKKNQTERYKEDFPFISPCGRELNYIRCDDLPVVFATIIEDPDDIKAPGQLTFSGTGDILTFPFQPEKVCMLPESGRIYHPGPQKVGGVALVKSSLAIELSPYFEYRKGNQDHDSPTHFNWKGICYELDNSMW